jgi:hypothetical protein
MAAQQAEVQAHDFPGTRETGDTAATSARPARGRRHRRAAITMD